MDDQRFLLYLAGYLLLINLLAFLTFGLDKRRARQRGRRISEHTLFRFVLLGGSLGAWLAMRIFRHKTLHALFRYGVPLTLLLQLAAIAYFALGLHR